MSPDHVAIMNATRLVYEYADLTMHYMTLLSAFLASYLPYGIASPKYCKPYPGSPDWPTIDAWQQLNSSIDGQLLSPPPPGAVCHPEHDLFNNASCTELRQNWISSSWHAQNPITSDYNDNSCIPDPAFNCSRDGYPAYTVNATKAEHVAAAVNFARETGVRLVIKGTGHDFPGRSAGAGSLSIHTHYLRGIEIIRDDPMAAKYGSPAAVKIAAGMRMFELYEAAAEEDLVVVGGGDLNVGVGGWTGGGGHSPISSLYGLGADNVLEMEVVAADGKIRTINENHDADLFWAMRGGGPGNWAVMLSVTMRAHPVPTLSSYVFNFNTTALSPTFWNMTAAFHAAIPTLADAGGMGYYWTLPNASLFLTADDLPPIPGLSIQDLTPASSGLLLGMLMFTSPTNLTSASTLLEDSLQSLTPTQPDPIGISSATLPAFPFPSIWAATTPQTVGSTATRLGSYLLSRDALTQPLPALSHALAAASDHAPYPQLGHMVAGPAVHSPPGGIPGGSNAVLPAWRKTYSHLVLPAGWEGTTEEEGRRSRERLQSVRIQALRELDEEGGMGSYANEGDVSMETGWEGEFWGENYGRLKEVKGRWDPEGVFWCRGCVGSEEWAWSLRDGKGREEGEGGVGQEVGRLCRA